MDDIETQDSSSLSPSSARDGTSSLPKMHSLVQCGTEKYWEIESSGENWLRFIKADSGPLFGSQTSNEDEQESNASRQWIFPSIASTEPKSLPSDGSSRKEMIIQLEVCFVTGIGPLLAVKAIEDSHGAIYTIENGLPSRSRSLLEHRKLHLMRPEDKLCYVQNGDELLLEYRCETVIETSDTQNFSRESFSNIDPTQESDVLMTQQDYPNGQDVTYLTQEVESEFPCSQTSAMRPPVGLTKSESSLQQHLQKQESTLEASNKKILNCESNGSEVTVDPIECKTDLSKAVCVTNDNVMIRPTSSLSDRNTSEHLETDESPGLFAPTQPSGSPLPAMKNPMSPELLANDSPSEKQLMKTRKRKRNVETLIESENIRTGLKPHDHPTMKTERVTRSRTGTLGTPSRKGIGGEIPRILITGYEVDYNIEALVSKIGGTIIQDLAEAITATHVVAKDLKRTLKLMIGLCCTNKIVTFDWLRASAESEKPLPHEEFLVIDKVLFDQISRNLKVGKVLKQSLVYFCDCVTKPPPDECRLLVEAAGGTILTNLSTVRGRFKKQLIIVRKGRNFSKPEKTRCTPLIKKGAITWTLEDFLNVIVTQSRP